MEDEVGQYVEEGLMVRRQMSGFGEGYRGAGSARRGPDPGTSVFVFFFLGVCLPTG